MRACCISCWPVDDVDPGALKGEQHDRLGDVDADGLAEQAALLERAADLLGDVLGAP